MRRTELQILCIRFCEYMMGIVSKVMTFFNAYALSHDQIISYVKSNLNMDRISLNTVLSKSEKFVEEIHRVVS